MAAYSPGDVVSVTAARGAGLLLAICRVAAVSGERLDLRHLRGAPLREFPAGDRVSLILETEEASFQATACIADVRPPDEVSVRLEGDPVERARRAEVRIDDRLGFDYAVVKGVGAAAVDAWRRRAARGAAQSRLTAAGAEDARNERIVRALQGIDFKVDAIARFLSGADRGALRIFEPRWVNLSASGIRFVVPDEIGEGDFLEVRLLLPDGGGPPVEFLGEAVRVGPARDGEARGCEVALRYVCVDEPDRERIARHIFARAREAAREECGGGSGSLSPRPPG